MGRQSPYLPHQVGGLLKLPLSHLAGTVGNVGDLVQIVADGGKLPRQIFVAVRRAGLDLAAVHQAADKGFHFESRCGSLLLQRGILPLRKADGQFLLTGQHTHPSFVLA